MTTSRRLPIRVPMGTKTRTKARSIRREVVIGSPFVARITVGWKRVRIKREARRRCPGIRGRGVGSRDDDVRICHILCGGVPNDHTREDNDAQPEARPDLSHWRYHSKLTLAPAHVNSKTAAALPRGRYQRGKRCKWHTGDTRIAEGHMGIAAGDSGRRAAIRLAATRNTKIQ